MFLTQAIGWIMAVLIVVGCLLLLWGMVSFSIIEPGRQRGWQQRLRQPNPAEVAARWNIRVPPSVELLFQNTIVKESEFYLRPPVGDSSITWYIEHFIPFTSRDLTSWLKITRVPGLPIAVDGSKGVYYLPFDDLRIGKSPRVLFQTPGETPPAQVALTIEDFLHLAPVGMASPSPH